MTDDKTVKAAMASLGCTMQQEFGKCDPWHQQDCPGGHRDFDYCSEHGGVLEPGAHCPVAVAAARAAIEAHEAAKGERVRKSVTVERDGDMVSVRMYGTREGGVSDDLNSLTIRGRYPAHEATTSEGEMLEPGVTYTYSPSKGFKRKEDPTPAPVVVETVEEFCDLPPDTPVLTDSGAVGKSGLFMWTDNGGETHVGDLVLPATVLTPATSATVSAEQVEAGAMEARAHWPLHDPTVAWDGLFESTRETWRVVPRAALRAAGLPVAEDGA